MGRAFRPIPEDILSPFSVWLQLPQGSARPIPCARQLFHCWKLLGRNESIAVPGDPGLLYSRTHFLLLFPASRPSAFSLPLTLYFLAQKPEKEQNRGNKELIRACAQEGNVEVGAFSTSGQELVPNTSVFRGRLSPTPPPDAAESGGK